MSVSEPWGSENVVEGATTAILLGPLDRKTLEEECSDHPKGVLWIGPGDAEGGNPPPPGLVITRITDSSEVIQKAIRGILGSEYEMQPTVKASQESETDSPEAYSDILSLIIAEIDSTFRSRKTREEVGFQRQAQVMTNLRGYLGGRVPEEWRGMASNCLAVVVGAGPSLDQTLPLLQKGLPKPVVVAADSSLRALQNYEIEPDFVVSIDPEKIHTDCSREDYCPGIAILSSQSHGSWLAKWGEKSRFLSGRVLTEDWLAEKGIGKTRLQAVNNAGLTALLFADFLEPAAILMAGMDLSGGGDGRERYAESTGRSHMQIHASHFHKVPGNFAPTVPTPFLSDWQETSDLTGEVSRRRMVMNLNYRGAKLEGATVIHPEDIDGLKEAVSENLSPFASNDEEIMHKRKSLQGNGLNQLLTLLASRCDLAWKNFPCNTKDYNAVLNYLRELFTDQDMARLLGDFAFSILPKIGPGGTIGEDDLNKAVRQLENLIWKLEDAILECGGSEEFLLRFLTETFD
tara:strand:+ start:1369 stop:2919 length:1551 start_codon:yes stop_codon:yes gene_type:complete